MEFFRDDHLAVGYLFAMPMHVRDKKVDPPKTAYRALFAQTLIPMALVSARGAPRFVAVSHGFLDAIHMKRGAVEGREIGEVVDADGTSTLIAALQHCTTMSETVQMPVRFGSSDAARPVHMTIHAANVKGLAGYALLEIVSGRQALPSGLERRPWPSYPGDTHGMSLTYVNDLKSGQIRFIDEGLGHLLGLPADGVLSHREFRSRIHPDDADNLPAYESLRDDLSDEGFAALTVRVRDRGGEWRLVNFRSQVSRRDRHDGVRTLVGVAIDITDFAAAAVEAAGLSVTSAEENERARIGRELHDSTSQFLVAADLGLLKLLHHPALPDDVRSQVRGLQASLAAAQTEMRAFAYFLHPPELRDLGLRKSLEQFCLGFARRSGVAITLVCAELPEGLAPDVEHAIFRICQESLMNVHRHAFARTAAVTVGFDGGELRLEIRDDGIGVDHPERFEQGGVGLSGMRARMRSLGGRLDLDLSGPGVAVIASAPVELIAGPAGLVPRAESA